MITGSRKLSNSAASARKIMISAKPNVAMKPTSPGRIAGSSRRNRPYSPRQRARGEVLQEFQRVALRHARRGDAHDLGAVELLKVIERFRHRLGDDGGEVDSGTKVPSAVRI